MLLSKLKRGFSVFGLSSGMENELKPNLINYYEMRARKAVEGSSNEKILENIINSFSSSVESKSACLQKYTFYFFTAVFFYFFVSTGEAIDLRVVFLNVKQIQIPKLMTVVGACYILFLMYQYRYEALRSYVMYSFMLKFANKSFYVNDINGIQFRWLLYGSSCIEGDKTLFSSLYLFVPLLGTIMQIKKLDIMRIVYDIFPLAMCIYMVVSICTEPKFMAYEIDAHRHFFDQIMHNTIDCLFARTGTSKYFYEELFVFICSVFPIKCIFMIYRFMRLGMQLESLQAKEAKN